MQKIKLKSIQCTLPDEIDKDEAYLKFNDKKIWPPKNLYHRLDVGDVAEVDVTLEVKEEWVSIELWEFDYLSGNDHLGIFKFKVDDSPGAYTNTMISADPKSTASYMLMWEIL